MARIVDGGVFVSGLADHLSVVWRGICQSLNADMLLRMGPTAVAALPTSRIAPRRSVVRMTPRHRDEVRNTCAEHLGLGLRSGVRVFRWGIP
ncbi:hypothetical protein D5H75_39865 [Bailinhaonella thermotolerans]|uniref:Uncharacterized protein n=1 Tax=Bailinhaonella thermotolerans TaxID=1070861 RepID=A0A3A4A041_9ACTN|nr:hypothetical protein D5H75_39865 [Bailinhaonella thermotolerans]